MDLVRLILLAIEEHEHGRAPDQLHVDGYDSTTVGYHVFIMNEGGLLVGVDSTHMKSDGFQAAPIRLTWAGHEFLDAARDENRWQRAISLVSDAAGSVTISVMSQLLASMMKKAVGIGDPT